MDANDHAQVMQDKMHFVECCARVLDAVAKSVDESTAAELNLLPALDGLQGACPCHLDAAAYILVRLAVRSGRSGDEVREGMAVIMPEIIAAEFQ